MKKSHDVPHVGRALVALQVIVAATAGSTRQLQQNSGFPSPVLNASNLVPTVISIFPPINATSPTAAHQPYTPLVQIRPAAAPVPSPASLSDTLNATAVAAAIVNDLASDPPKWGGCFYAAKTGSPPSYAPAGSPYNSSVVFTITQPDEMQFSIVLQTALLPGDYIRAAYLVGNSSSMGLNSSSSNSSSPVGSSPDEVIIAYLVGPNGHEPPPVGKGNGQGPWTVAQGLLYAEDIDKKTGYDFYDLPARMSGWTTVNPDPLFLVLDTKYFKGALVAGYQYGLQPMNAAALQFMDSPTVPYSPSDDPAGGNSTFNATAGSSPMVALAPSPPTQEWAINLTAFRGVKTNSSGVVSFQAAPSNRSLSFSVALQGVTPDALILNMTLWRGQPQAWPQGDNLLYAQRFGLDNGYPLNGPLGLAPTSNGSAFLLSSGDIPDSILLATEHADDEQLRYHRILAALQQGKLYLAVATEHHPERLLAGTAVPGHAVFPDDL